MTVLGGSEDPDGRPVKLTRERWEHIVDEAAGHLELIGFRRDMLIVL